MTSHIVKLANYVALFKNIIIGSYLLVQLAKFHTLCMTEKSDEFLKVGISIKAIQIVCQYLVTHPVLTLQQCDHIIYIYVKS